MVLLMWLLPNQDLRRTMILAKAVFGLIRVLLAPLIRVIYSRNTYPKLWHSTHIHHAYPLSPPVLVPLPIFALQHISSPTFPRLLLLLLFAPLSPSRRRVAEPTLSWYCLGNVKVAQHVLAQVSCTTSDPTITLSRILPGIIRVASASSVLDQPPPPSLRDILGAYKSNGDGDRDMLLAMLNAKTAEDQRLASLAALHRTMLEFYQSSPPLSPLNAAHRHTLVHPSPTCALKALNLNIAANACGLRARRRYLILLAGASPYTTHIRNYHHPPTLLQEATPPTIRLAPGGR
ncbi:hypothetical protein C8F04DRAFT_1390555 [Mycena alexandri]|uniref:Uncharacterized protein n=1 Tax=Mycena alexandri TaxID=1745969 RepID=A0AAD6TA33_9AGAR|nr:hypothetical protein C8F04DRAFT_1390555 [Mycena alexandri]